MKSSHKSTRKLVAEFDVPGEPVSKSRARFTKRGSKTVAYTPQKTLDGERRVALAFRHAMGRLPLNPTDNSIAYRVEAEFHNGTRQRRDVDNMTKLILDGLNGVAWVDDDQVLEIEARKDYVPKAEASTRVRVFEVGTIIPPQAKCIRCGKEFRTYESWVNNPSGKKYCSRQCFASHRVEQKRRRCAQCHVEFMAWGKSHETKYCSMACKSKAGRAEVACTMCGVTFSKQRAFVRASNYCSDECMRTAERRRAAKRRTTYFPGTCQVCGSGTTRKEYKRCNACKIASQKTVGKPIIVVTEVESAGGAA